MFDRNLAFFKYIGEFIEGKTTIQNIEDFEKNYNIKLPNDYIEFLIKYNGIILFIDYIKNNKYYSLYNEYLEKMEKGFCEFFLNIHQINDKIKEYLCDEFTEELDIIKNKKILPFALNSYGHDYLGLGYGKENFGKIYTWTDDWDYEVFFVCDSFKEFIEGYYLIEIDQETGEPIGEKIYTIED